MQRLSGRKALVTGASRGIGSAIAERLAAEGADVVITARTVDRHDHLAGSLNETLERCRRYGTTVTAVAADLADPASRARLVPSAMDALGGRVDVLVNNAAAAIYGPMLEYSAKRARLSIEVNVFAPMELTQAVVPGMVERGEGWVVNVSSATARPAPGPPFRTSGVSAKIGFYGASKAALNRVTNAFAVELYGKGVRVNTVEPRAAVMSEGADALVGGTLTDDQIESMEAMVESVLALCDCPPERTGQVFVSLDLLDELSAPVMCLDGRTPYPGGQRPVRA
ncbi:MAG TPA: SDR family NAD(P)-dependent oxidoreductase [Acidimicrobiales bacterium]|nr:SDR family NAD(P)-dependent oxidoreductase [Acidimicrobiales bacterium]